MLKLKGWTELSKLFQLSLRKSHTIPGIYQEYYMGGRTRMLWTEWTLFLGYKTGYYLSLSFRILQFLGGWVVIFVQIKAITGQNVSKRSGRPHLNLLMGDNVKQQFKPPISSFLLAARLIIMRYWNNLEGASLTNWHSKVWQKALVEKLNNKMKLAQGLKHKDSFVIEWLIMKMEDSSHITEHFG